MSNKHDDCTDVYIPFVLCMLGLICVNAVLIVCMKTRQINGFALPSHRDHQIELTDNNNNNRFAHMIVVLPPGDYRDVVSIGERVDQ